jgi:excinuclease ABC subunit B
VASVSCIYNLGTPDEYKDMCVVVEKNKTKSREQLIMELVNIHYERNDIDFSRAKFRVRGDTVEIYPAYLETAIRVEFYGDHVERIREIEPLTGKATSEKDVTYIYPAKHFVTTRPKLEIALKSIEKELEVRVDDLNKQGKLIEAQRIDQRTRYDMEMMNETGFCHGVENYSTHLAGRSPESRPSCLLDYFKLSNPDFLTVIDESHISIPQIRGMYAGDKARKQTLVDFGFRLPSALGNRPLKFHEFESLTNNVIYVSATPGTYELTKTKGEIIELVIRPTGLIDPEVVIHPIDNQVEDLRERIEECVKKKERVLVTTLTKKMSEDLTDYYKEKGLKVEYLHSEIDALKRIEILNDLRRGKFDVLIGINLLREGLDLPEVALVAVLDADKEGFLRSETTLIQVCGRAARNVDGRVILYADKITGSMKRAMDEMDRRRKKQAEFNLIHNITPKSIIKAVTEFEEFRYHAKEEGLAHVVGEASAEYVTKGNISRIMDELEKQMKDAADNLDFELAAALRDKLFALKEMGLKKKKIQKK